MGKPLELLAVKSIALLGSFTLLGGLKVMVCALRLT
jgi:hypothetical protein